MSIKSENNDEDFDEESCTIDDDDDVNSNTETEGNSKVNELQILYNAALILHYQKYGTRWRRTCAL